MAFLNWANKPGLGFAFPTVIGAGLAVPPLVWEAETELASLPWPFVPFDVTVPFVDLTVPFVDLTVPFALTVPLDFSVAAPFSLAGVEPFEDWMDSRKQ